MGEITIKKEMIERIAKEQGITSKELIYILNHPIVNCNLCMKKTICGDVYNTYYSKYISVPMCQSCIDLNTFSVYL